jgi:hypothetical protein
MTTHIHNVQLKENQRDDPPTIHGAQWPAVSATKTAVDCHAQDKAVMSDTSSISNDSRCNHTVRRSCLLSFSAHDTRRRVRKMRRTQQHMKCLIPLPAAPCTPATTRSLLLHAGCYLIF